MSLPQNISTSNENFIVLDNFATDPDFLYLYSQKETEGLSHLSIYNNKEEKIDKINTPIDNLNSLIDLDPTIYKKFRDDSTKQIQEKQQSFTKSLRNSVTEFHIRNSTQVNSSLFHRVISPYIKCSDMEVIQQKAFSNRKFDSINGKNPGKWPVDLDEFLNDVKKLPSYSFFNETEEIHQEFLKKALQVLNESVYKLQTCQVNEQQETFDLVSNCTLAVFFVLHNKSNLSQIVEFLQLIIEISNKLPLQFKEKYLSNLQEHFINAINSIEKDVKDTQQLHYMRSLCDQGGFKIAKVALFQKQNFMSTSMTTDGTYLYIYVGSSNGGVYKIGTGENNSTPGHIYLYNHISKQDEISWVYLKEKLYLRSNSKEPGTIEIICPHTLKTEGMLQLYCKEMFNQPQSQVINKNYPLLTDGRYLYVIGKKITIEQILSEPGELLVELSGPKKKESVQAEKIDRPQSLEKLEKLDQISDLVDLVENQILLSERDSDIIEIQKAEKLLFEQQQVEAKISLKKNQKKTKDEKKQPPKKESKVPFPPEKDENVFKMMEFLLYEFDVENPVGGEIDENEEDGNLELAQELYESFAGFFTINECLRALQFAADDISSAAQWLVDEGEKERTKTTIEVKKRTVLAQSQIINDISQKNLKSVNEIINKENSLIFNLNVSGNIWTMNEKQITLYSEQGVKIFSKNPADVHDLDLDSSENMSIFSYLPITEKYLPSEQKPFDPQYILKQEMTFKQMYRDETENSDQMKKHFQNMIKIQQQQESIKGIKKGQVPFPFQDISLYNPPQGDKDIFEKMFLLKEEEGILQMEKQKIFEKLKEVKSALAPRPKKQFPLVGTHIKTVNIPGQNFTLLPNCHATYDSFKKKFYILNWVFNSHTNIFPSVITMSYDFNSYKDINLHQEFPVQESDLNSTSFISNILNTLLRLQKFRFDFPYRLNKWDYLFGFGLAQLASGQTKYKPTNEQEDKKRIGQTRGKLISRLNKTLLYNKNKIETEKKLEEFYPQFKCLKEIKKVYAFCVDGSLDELKVIQQLIIQNMIESDTLLQNILLYLSYWVQHADILITYDAEGIKLLMKIQKHFYEILTKQQLSQQIENLIFRVIISGFDLFCQTNQIQQNWLQLIIEKSFNQMAACNYSDDQIISEDDIFKSDITSFMQFYFKFAHRNYLYCPNYPFKDYYVELLKNDDIPLQVDITTNFTTLYLKNQIVKVSESSFIEPHGRILIQDLSYLNEQIDGSQSHMSFEQLFPHQFVQDFVDDYQRSVSQIQEQLQEAGKQKPKKKEDKPIKKEEKPTKSRKISSKNIQDHMERSEAFWKILYSIGQNSCEKIRVNGIYFWATLSKLFQESWNESQKIDDPKQEWQVKHQLTLNFCNLLEKSLTVLVQNYQNLLSQSTTYFQNLQDQLQKIIFLFSSLVLQSSVIRMPQNEEIIIILVRITDKMKKLLDVKCFQSGVTQNLLEKIFTMHSEGINQSVEKVFETNHPYERGKQFPFELSYFPGAVALSVEFDPLCQSDTTNDYMIISGWYDTHVNVINQSTTSKDGIGCFLKVSGKPNIKKPFTILGNTLQVEFYSNSQAKDGHSLNRWGFKINVRPIYGMKDSFKNHINKSPEYKDGLKRFGSAASFDNWVNSIKVLLIVSVEAIGNFIGFDNKKETSTTVSNFLKWAIIKNGLSGAQLEQFVSCEQGGILRLTKDIQFDLYDFFIKNFETQKLGNNKIRQLKNELFQKVYKCPADDSTDKQQENPEDKQNKQDEQKIKDYHKIHQDKSEICWDLQGKEMLQEYLMQVKEMKGEFVDFAKEIKSMTAQNQNFKMELMRQNFLPEYKAIWEQIEFLIILNILYHSGLISLKLKEIRDYIFGQIKGIQVSKNQIIGKMLSLVQQERELQQTLLRMSDVHALAEQKQNELKKQVDVPPTDQIPQPKKPTSNVKISRDKFIKQGKKMVIKQQPAQRPITAVPKKLQAREPEKEEEKKAEESEDDIIPHTQAVKKEIKEEKPPSPGFDLNLELWKEFEDRYRGNNEILKSICESLSIVMDEDNLQETTKNVFNICKSILQTFPKDPKTNRYVLNFRSPYQLIGKNMIKKCIFLLQISNNQSDTLSDDNFSEIKSFNSGEIKLTPIGMNRSISQPLNEKHIDKEKLKIFRSWIESYQQWKSYTKNEEEEADDVLLRDDCSPLKSIVSFLCSQVDINELRDQLQGQNLRCQKRIIGVSLLNMMYEVIQKTCFEKYVVGLLNDSFKNDCLANLSCASSELRDKLNSQLLNSLRYLIKMFNNKSKAIQSIKLQDIKGQINKGKNDLKVGGLDKILSEQLKNFHLNLAEIGGVLESICKHSKLTSVFDDHLSFDEFLNNIVNLSLLANSLQNLSQNYEDIITLSNYIIFDCWNIFQVVVNNLDPKSTQSSLHILNCLLEKEVGVIRSGDNTENYSVHVRIFYRISDIVCIQRLQIIFSFISDIIINKFQLINKENCQSLFKRLQNILFLILYHSETPLIVRLIIRILTYLVQTTEDVDSLLTPFEAKYIFKYCVNQEEIMQKLKQKLTLNYPGNDSLPTAIFETKELDFLKPQSQAFKINNFTLLLEKIGTNIYQEGSNPDSIQSVIQKTMKQTLKKANYQEKGNYFQNKFVQNNNRNLDNHYSVLAHLSEEEDITFLIKVFYYWEELYPTFSLNYPKTLEQYKVYLEQLNIKEQKNQQNVQQAEQQPEVGPKQQQRKYELIFHNIPQFNGLDQDEGILPLGWEFNYLGIYNDLKNNQESYKKGKVKKSVKKVWKNENLIALEKKYEELSKLLEEVKDQELENDKLEFIKVKNYVRRILFHLKEVHAMASLFNVFGFAYLVDYLPEDKAYELASLLNLAINNQLQPISLDHLKFKPEWLKKIDLEVLIKQIHTEKQVKNKAVEPVKEQTSNIVVQMLHSSVYPNFETSMDFITDMNPAKDNFYLDVNSNSVISGSCKIGEGTTSIVVELIEFTRAIMKNEAIQECIKPQLEICLQELGRKNWNEEFSGFEKSMIIGYLNLVGDWTQSIRPGCRVQQANVQNPNEILQVLQGGYYSGLKQCTIINTADIQMLQWTLAKDQILLKYTNEYDLQDFQNYNFLVEAICNGVDSVENSPKPQSDPSIINKIVLRSLLQISSKLSWNNALDQTMITKELALKFLEKLNKLVKFCPSDKNASHYEQEFVESWEYMIDKLQPINQLIQIPQIIHTDFKFIKDVEIPQLKKTTSSSSQLQENLIDFVLPPSPYISTLQEDQPKIDEQKMLKYWEKNIIPKIQDFTRSSFKPYEFDEYFEQMRQPLRKGDQAEATKIAFILCDQRLPAGCLLPDINHDWTTIGIEEVKIGQYALAKINSKVSYVQGLFLPNLRRLNQQTICVEVIGIDIKSSSVLCLFRNHDTSQLLSFWLPVTVLKNVEIPMKKTASSFPLEKIKNEFLVSIGKSTALLSRKTLLQFFSLMKNMNEEAQINLIKKQHTLATDLNLRLIDIIKWSAVEELSYDPIEGWIKANGCQVQLKDQSAQKTNYSHKKFIPPKNPLIKCQKLQQISHFLNWLTNSNDSNMIIQHLQQWLTINLPKVIQFINQKCYYADLHKASVDNNHRPIPLNIFEIEPDSGIDSIASLAIVFKKDAYLCMCSSLKFFSDPLGVNVLMQKNTGKEIKTNLGPYVFNGSNIYCSYFFNQEALPPFEREQKSVLPCLIYPIPSDWSVCAWLADTLGTSLTLSNTLENSQTLTKLNKTLIKSYSTLKGPNVLKQLLARLITRTCRKIRHLSNSLINQIFGSSIKNEEICKKQFEILGVDKPFVKALIKEANDLKEKHTADNILLPSSFSQDFFEMVATILTPIFHIKDELFTYNLQQLIDDKLPQWLVSLINVQLISLHLKGEGNLSEDIYLELQSYTQIQQQWERIIYIENIPVQWDREQLYKKIIEVCQLHNARILNPAIDIIIPNQKVIEGCIIILDGWATIDLNEESEEKKKKEEEEIELKEIEQPIEVESVTLWTCPICTFMDNPIEINICDMCQSAKPAEPPKALIQEEEIKKIDLNQVEQETQKKDQERFQKIIEDLKKMIQNTYNDQKSEISTKINLIKKLIEENQKESQPVQEKQIEEIKESLKDQKKKKKQKKEEEKKKEPNLIEDQKEEVAYNYLTHIEEDLKMQQLQLKNIEQLEGIVLAGKQIMENQKSKIFLLDSMRERLLKEGSQEEICDTVRINLVESFNTIAHNESIKKRLSSLLEINRVDDSVHLIEVFTQMCYINSINCWKVLEILGFDLWLNKVTYEQKIKPQFLSIQACEQLMRFIEVEMCKETKAVLTFNPTNIRFSRSAEELKPLKINNGELQNSILYETVEVLMRYPLLSTYTLREIRISWALLKTFNYCLQDSISSINMNVIDQTPKENQLQLFQANYFSMLRNLWMLPIKIELYTKVMTKTSLVRDFVPKLTIERLKMMNKEENKKEDAYSSKQSIISKNKDDFLMTKAYEQVKDISRAMFRPQKPSGTDPFLAFEVKLKGELVQGEGGPYRQFFADISSELQHNPLSSHTRNLNLLSPSVNNYSKIGEGRDKYVINPSAKSTYHLQLFEFLGLLMGCCIRTGTHLTLDLPKFFWKQLLGQEVEFEDLDEIDRPFCDLVKYIESCDKQMFQDIIQENYTTTLSDKTVVELIKNGSKIRVQFEDRFEYIQRIIDTRIRESELQLESIKKGICSIVPEPFLKTVSFNELEIWVCGKKHVDIDLLRRHTRYSGGLTDESPQIKYFWQVLQEMSENEKLRFVKFCWGQERLPSNDEEFERHQIRFMIKPSLAKNAQAQPDKWLPRADTCFFNIELPKYSSKQILKEKLLTAINFDCEGINADEIIHLDPNAHHALHEGDGGSSQDENLEE